MTDAGSTITKDPPPAPSGGKGNPGDGERDAERLAALAQLKAFAVAQGYEGVDGTLLTNIYRLLAKPVPLNAEDRAELDDLVIELSKITDPINIDNVANAEVGVGAGFVYLVIAFGFVMAIVSGLLIWVIHKGEIVEAAGTWLALTLGFLGAVVHVMLPNGRLNLYLGIDRANKLNSTVRIVMGGLLGFVLSTVVAPINNLALDPKQLVIPLLGGYSITLVVGILGKAVAALQMTFDIDTKSVRSSLKK